MEKLIHEISIAADGRFEIPEEFRIAIGSTFSGRDVAFTVERIARKRSKNQNDYYHAVIVKMIADEMRRQGNEYTNDEVHVFLRFRFLSESKVDEHGEEIWSIPKSTKNLKTYEFSEYMDKCIRFAAEYLHIPIPEPSKFRGEFQFDEIKRPGEDDFEFLERIEGYISDINSIPQLYSYFGQVPEWRDNEIIVKMFAKRKRELLG